MGVGQLRVLFVCHDAGGTVPPVLALAQAFVEAGDEVSILSQPSVRSRAASIGCAFHPFTSLGDYDRHVALEDQLALTLPALCGAPIGGDLLELAGRVNPDVVVVDPNLAGALAAAESLDCPSVVLLHSLYATFVEVWFGELWPLLADPINATRHHFGLGPAESWGSLFDGHDLVVSPVPSAFDAVVGSALPTMRSFGFLVPGEKGPSAQFPAGDSPAVLVSLSTTYQHQESLLAAIVDALGGLDVRAMVTTSGHVVVGELPRHSNVVVTDFADHSALLAEADVMVTHAGLGSVAAALSAGVPLVCAPISRDQPLNARRAADLGAAVVVETPTADAIAIAVQEVIASPSYRAAARRLAEASVDEGGARRAAIELRALMA